jgi:hypothetical protein
MAERITYYAMLLGDRTVENPSGLARRRHLNDGSVRDEAIGRDLEWSPNPALAGWERGDLTTTFAEVSEEEALRIIENFRARWAAEA